MCTEAETNQVNKKNRKRSEDRIISYISILYEQEEEDYYELKEVGRY